MRNFEFNRCEIIDIIATAAVFDPLFLGIMKMMVKPEFHDAGEAFFLEIENKHFTDPKSLIDWVKEDFVNFLSNELSGM